MFSKTLAFSLGILTFFTASFAASVKVDKFRGGLQAEFCDMQFENCPLPLKIIRKYNSKNISFPGIFGPGWSSNLDVRLIKIKNNDFLLSGPFGGCRILRPVKDNVWGDKKGVLVKEKTCYIFRSFDRKTNYVFDLRKRIWSFFNAQSQSMRFYYNSLGQLASLKNKFNQWIKFKYDKRGQLVEVYNSSGQKVSYRYDKQGRLVSMDNPIDKQKYVYRNKLLIEKIKTGIFHWKVRYDKSARVTMLETPAGNIHYKRFNIPAGRLIKILSPGSQEQQILVYKDGSGYEEISNGIRKLYLLDKRGQLKELITPDGKVSYTWDVLGRLLKTVENGSSSISYKYKGYNFSPSEIIKSSGEKTTYTFDKAYRVTGIKSGKDSAELRYDKLGRLVFRKDKAGVSKYYFSKLNPWVASKITLNDKIIMQTEFDKAGNVISVVSNGKKQNVKDLRRDVRNELFSKRLVPHSEITSADGLKYMLDDNANVVMLRYPSGLIRRSKYDKRGNIIETFLELNNKKTVTKKYTYDKYDNPASETNARGQTKKFSYDGFNRLKKVRFPNGDITSYSYDKFGNVIAIYRKGELAQEFKFNKYNQLLSETSSNRKVIYQPDGSGVDIDYFKLRWEKSADGANEVIKHDKYKIYVDNTKNCRKTTFPNGIISTRTVDPEKRTVTTVISNLLRKKLYSEICTYNKKGKIIKRVVGNKTIDYKYDKAGQLIKAGKYTYSYDAWGRRKSSSDGVLKMKYQFNPLGQITKFEEISLEYDLDGNMKTVYKRQRKYQSMSYSCDNEMLKLDLGNNILEFDYKDNGLLEKIVQDGKESTLVYAGLNPLADFLRNRIRYYISGPGLDEIYGVSVLTSKGNQNYYYHKNELGNIVLVTDEQANVSGSADYSPFGREDGITIGQDTAFLYQSARFFNFKAMYNMRARFYLAPLGVFCSRDPLPGNVAQKLSTNPYIYAMNDPVNMNDPLGRQAVKKKWDQSHMSGTAEGCVYDSIASMATSAAELDGMTTVTWKSGRKSSFKATKSTMSWLKQTGKNFTKPAKSYAAASRFSGALGDMYDAGKLLMSAAELDAKVKSGSITRKQAKDAMNAEIVGAGMGRLAGWGSSAAGLGLGGGLLVGVTANVAADQYKEAYRQSGKLEDAAVSEEEAKLLTQINNHALMKDKMDKVKELMGSGDIKKIREARLEVAKLQSFAYSNDEVPSKFVDYFDKLEERVEQKIEDAGKPKFVFNKPDNADDYRDKIHKDKEKRFKNDDDKTNKKISKDELAYWERLRREAEEKARQRKEDAEFWNGVAGAFGQAAQEMQNDPNSPYNRYKRKYYPPKNPTGGKQNERLPIYGGGNGGSGNKSGGNSGGSSSGKSSSGGEKIYKGYIVYSCHWYYDIKNGRAVLDSRDVSAHLHTATVPKTQIYAEDSHERLGSPAQLRKYIKRVRNGSFAIHQKRVEKFSGTWKQSQNKIRSFKSKGAQKYPPGGWSM